MAPVLFQRTAIRGSDGRFPRKSVLIANRQVSTLNQSPLNETHLTYPCSYLSGMVIYVVLDILYEHSSSCMHCPQEKSEMGPPRLCLGKSIDLISSHPFLNHFRLAFKAIQFFKQLYPLGPPLSFRPSPPCKAALPLGSDRSEI
jgi:hypothetical protein